mgnify:CR=1 FL=1
MSPIWKMSAGKGSQFWIEFVQNNLMAFGAWDEGDLKKYSSIERLSKRLQEYSKRKFGKGTTSHN